MATHNPPPLNGGESEPSPEATESPVGIRRGHHHHLTQEENKKESRRRPTPPPIKTNRPSPTQNANSRSSTIDIVRLGSSPESSSSKTPPFSRSSQNDDNTLTTPQPHHSYMVRRRSSMQVERLPSWEDFKADIEEYNKNRKRKGRGTSNARYASSMNVTDAVDLFNVSGNISDGDQDNDGFVPERVEESPKFISSSKKKKFGFGSTTPDDSHSTPPLAHSVYLAPDDWSENRLLTIKRLTDHDIKLFLMDLNQFSQEKKEELPIIEKIRRICQQVVATNIKQLKSGGYVTLIQKMRSLMSETSCADTKRMIRKLLFIFSRCTRFLEYIRRNTIDKLSSESTDELVSKSDSTMTKKLISKNLELRSAPQKDDTCTEVATGSMSKSKSDEVLDSASTKPIPLAKKTSSATLSSSAPKQTSDSWVLLNKKDVDQKHISITEREVVLDKKSPQISPVQPKDSPKTSTLNKLIKKLVNFSKGIAGDTSPRNSPRTSPDVSSRHSSRERRTPHVEILCRICEELIDANDLKEHSKSCSLRHDIENRLVTADERLKRLCNSIQKRIRLSSRNRTSRVSRSNDPDRPEPRQLSTQEVKILENLAKLALSVSELTYTPESISQCEALLKEANIIREDSPRIEVKDENSETWRKTKTIQVYSKRISEVIQQKLDDMQKRLELPVTDISAQPKIKKHKTTIHDFDIIKPISRGAFGIVFLARKKKTKDLFAIKAIKKASLTRRKQSKRVLAERNIMAMASNDFIVKFYYSFQGKNNLYIVMEYCRGGDVFSLLQKHLEQGQAFSIEITKQFICETILALRYLHNQKIVHRDLKPDNLLICEDGHIKLTDFGLSDLGLIDLDPFYAETVIGSPLLSPHLDRAKSRNYYESNERFRGTPDYLAPEILLGEDHSFPVDWWAVGILLFEFLYGCPPFNADTPSEIFDNILSLNIPWPDPRYDDTPRDAIDLIKKLLVLDPKKRLGANGAEEVMKHPFFSDVDWKHLRNMRPHFVPQLENEEDLGCFSPRQRIFPVSSDQAHLEEESISPPKSDDICLSPPNRTHISGSLNNQSGSFEDIMSPLGHSIDFSFVRTDALAELTMKDRRKRKSSIDSSVSEEDEWTDVSNSSPAMHQMHTSGVTFDP